MRTFYHVDRVGKLETGQTLGSIPFLAPENDPIDEQLKKLFNNQVSFHGYNYAMKPIKNDELRKDSFIIEWIFELVRQKWFIDRPSRFQSVFAFPTQDVASTFLEKHRESYPDAIIWKVQGQKFFTADMKLLHNSEQNGILTIKQAFDYWSGETSDDPIFEVLLPEITIVEKVEI